MDLVPFQPFKLFSQWPSLWDDQELITTGSSGNLDVYETEDQIVVKTNVAGVEAKDVDLTFEDGILWIKAEREEETNDEPRTHYTKSSWSYSYKIAIPGKIDPTQEPKAEIDNGVLTVNFKKSELTKPKKLIVTTKEK